MESMAGYSLVCFFMQIKDRHNGNIMLDERGHIVHIDFGFMLSNSPGGVNFEAAPFKLTRELLEVMDSNSEGKASELFDYYKVTNTSHCMYELCYFVLTCPCSFCPCRHTHFQHLPQHCQCTVFSVQYSVLQVCASCCATGKGIKLFNLSSCSTLSLIGASTGLNGIVSFVTPLFRPRSMQRNKLRLLEVSTAMQCNAMPSGVVYTRFPGVSQACRPRHPAGGDDAGQRLPSFQSWPSLCPQLTQALPSEPHGDAGEYIIFSQQTFQPANANMVVYLYLFLQH